MGPSDDADGEALDRRKRALRASVLEARATLAPEERHRASVTIAARLGALRELVRAGVVATYVATADEPDLAALTTLLASRGVRVLAPRIAGDGLELADLGPVATLRPGPRGIPEPTGPGVAFELVDAVLVPGVAFDPTGGRLGRGGGHYDRLLAALDPDAVRVGVAFACQVVPAVPRAVHDVDVDVVVTERSVHRAPPRGDAVA